MLGAKKGSGFHPIRFTTFKKTGQFFSFKKKKILAQYIK
jgi:hypothetical protein